MTNPTCTIDGCDRPARSKAADWCPMHYHRWYRHGDPMKTSRGMDIGKSKHTRYQAVHRPGHPLADTYGNAYLHRVVLFDAIGVGPHACHWCGTEVEWKRKGEQGELHPDHLNNDTRDNRLENLAPACRTCNASRGTQRRAGQLRDMGWWSRRDTQTRLAPIETRSD